MSVITAVPQPALASVGLTVTGAPATVTLYRTDEDGNIATVRGSPFTTSGGAVATVDHEAPFGHLIYSTTNPAGVDAVSLTLTSSTPWRGAMRAMTASTSSSGAEAPAVTPTVPARSSGSSSGPLTR